jgi:hypothetical protein
MNFLSELTEQQLQKLRENFKIGFENDKKYSNQINNLTIKEFNDLVFKLISKHDSNYVISCHKKGYEPCPNILLTKVINYVMVNGEDTKPIDDLTKTFTSELRKYGNFIFALTFGQGACFTLYDLEGNLLLRL